MRNYPRYKANIAAGKGWAGKLAVKFHLTSYLKGKSKLKIPVGGVLGAGKMLLSLGIATISVAALTIYFLFALPGVRRLWLSLIPRSRRERVDLLTSEVFTRVGGFMLGNLADVSDFWRGHLRLAPRVWRSRCAAPRTGRCAL